MIVTSRMWQCAIKALLQLSKFSLSVADLEDYRVAIFCFVQKASLPPTPFLSRKCLKILIRCYQAVCVTTHKGSWVKLLLCLISIVTRSSSHLVREMNQTQGSKHCCLFRKTLLKRAISRIFKISQWPQMLAIGFTRQFQEVYRDSETIVRSSRL